jgi:hypothetical protein
VPRPAADEGPSAVFGGQTTILEIPLAVAVSYCGKGGALPPRSATFTATVTYTFTGTA